MKTLRAFQLPLVAWLISRCAAIGVGDPLDDWRSIQATGTPPDHAIRYGQGKWLGLKRDWGAGTSLLVASTNGYHWAVQAMFEPSEAATDLDFADGLWVLVGTREPTNIFVLSSTNGENWISTAVPPDGYMQHPLIRHSPEEWVVMSMTSSRLLRSRDGQNWSSARLGIPPSDAPNGGRIEDIVYGEGRWVAAVSEDFDSGGVGSLAISTNLTDWQWWRRPALPWGTLFYSLKYAHGLWLGVSGDYWVGCSAGTSIISSIDGTNWVGRFSASRPGPELGGEITLADNRLLAIASIRLCGVITTNSPPPDFPIFESAPFISLQQSRPGELTVQRAAGVPVVLEWTDDLHRWQTLTNLSLGAAVQPFTDPAAASTPLRFYRARTP